MDLSVSDIMTRKPICFPPIVTVGKVYDVLRNRRHHCFPVVAVDSRGNPTGVLMGSVARKVSTFFLLPDLLCFCLDDAAVA